MSDVEMVSDCTCLAEAGATGVWQGSSAGGSSLGLLMAVAATTSLGELGTGRSSIMPPQKGSWEGCLGWEKAWTEGGHTSS